jgi:hypothetical protein
LPQVLLAFGVISKLIRIEAEKTIPPLAYRDDETTVLARYRADLSISLRSINPPMLMPTIVFHGVNLHG